MKIRTATTRIALVSTLTLAAGCQYLSFGGGGDEAPSEEPAMSPSPTPPPIPAGVSHIDNPEWQDMETPTDKPEVNETKAKNAVANARNANAAAVKKACKNKANVYAVVGEGTRVGYVSYKNKELPVAGVFSTAGAHIVTGKYARMKGYVDITSLDSGDEVRDAKLKKLFFQIEKPGLGAMRFASTEVTGLGEPLPEETGATRDVTITGDLTLHGKSSSVSLPMTVTRMDGYWEAKLSQETLLDFEPFGLIDPLKALIKSCNHKFMGSSAKLDITLRLEPACQ